MADAVVTSNVVSPAAPAAIATTAKPVVSTTAPTNHLNATPAAKAAAAQKPATLAAQAKPAVAAAKVSAAQAQAAIQTKRQQQSQYRAVRGLRGSKTDVANQLQQQNLSADELALVKSKVQSLNAQAVHVDLHSFTESDSSVLQVHVRKLF